MQVRHWRPLIGPLAYTNPPNQSYVSCNNNPRYIL